MSKTSIDTHVFSQTERPDAPAAASAGGPAHEAALELSSATKSSAYRQAFSPESRSATITDPNLELVASAESEVPVKIVDKTQDHGDTRNESRETRDMPEGKPRISVELQNKNQSDSSVPDFVIKKDGTIEMYRNPETSKSPNLTVQLEREDGQLNPTEAQKKSAEQLVRQLSEQLNKQYPQESQKGIELEDKDGVISESAEKASNLLPPADEAKLSPQTRETMAEMNRFRGTGGGVDMPHAATERMASFNTRQVPPEASESQKQTWVKEAWAGLFRPDSEAPYETLRKGSDGGYRYGRYGFSGDQFLSFLDSLGDPPNLALIEELIAKGKLPRDFGNKLKNPEFLKRMKETAQKMKSGEGVDKSELSELFPKEAQESIANLLVDQASAIVGNKPGAISAALMSGKSPVDVTEADLNTPEAKQLSTTGQQIYEVASKRSGSDGTADGAIVGEVPEGERRELISKALKLAGVPVNDANLSAVNTIVQKESSWNPNAKNNWDWNAQQGHPSEGLMQTIPSTFKAYALPGYDKNMTDPLSNLIAGIRYAQSRYGSLQNVPGLVAMANNGGYVGY
jgi:hypothetical protein